MSLKFPDLGYQFFSNVLKGKGVDQPTIDFVWEHGESLFLWQQWFGGVTRDGMRKLGELTEVINVEPKNMPPLRGPEWRVKPAPVVLEYRRYIRGKGQHIGAYVDTICPQFNTPSQVELAADFIRWIDTDWQIWTL